MHTLLSKLLKKRGIEDLQALKPDEKQTYDSWQKILSEGEITVKSIEAFCRRQIDIIEKKWRDPSFKERERLVDQHIIYKTLLDVISAPLAERESLEKYLAGLVI